MPVPIGLTELFFQIDEMSFTSLIDWSDQYENNK